MVISFSRLGNYGRIGNQLFQVASTLGIAESCNAEASFPPWKYEKYFKDPIPHNGLVSRPHNEKHYHYEKIEISQDADLFGYFQSHRYFPNNYKPKFSEEIISQWGNHEAFKKETIAIHIRRGDYINHECYYQLPISWYISALLSIPNWKDCNILFFSDDMEYLKVHFECLPNAFFIPGFEIDHLCLMSLCDHHIIPNSTFSWWGAYLSEQKNVIHSGKMFRGSFAHKDIKDFYPPNWNEHKEEKIDLSDVTFTIPVLYDHNDRKQNIDLGLCMLQKDFHTNIIIGEQGKEKKFEYTGKWAKYHYFEGMDKFHRTKMLNEMAVMAETEIIVNWDADIIIPPMQIYLAAERLREGVDCVYPYDGRFARMDRIHWFRKLETQLDIGCVGKSPLDHRNIRESVGGAVMWRKESFIDFGMENEYMISYAPEDVERWERMHTLGVNVQRVNGTLFHMNHFKGIDSHNGNPNFPNSKAELAKMRAMSKDEMRLYIDGWPWRHKYTESYYHRISEGAIRSAEQTMYTLQKYWGIDGFGVNTLMNIIDIGCGVGEWSLGNPNYFGIDHNIPDKALMIPKDNYLDSDFETAIPIREHGGKYDLCLCLEVAEHISESRADVLIQCLCTLSDSVLFSAAVWGQGGTGHINEQPASYWAKKFEANGFYPSKFNIRKAVFHNPNVEIWYKNNMILYVNKKEEIDYEIDFIHPEMFASCIRWHKNK